MGKNNICVIYDSDENYAKRLMSIINDDNEIPYNAQVFTNASCKIKLQKVVNTLDM